VILSNFSIASRPIKKFEILLHFLRQDQYQDFSVFNILIPVSGSLFFPLLFQKIIIFIIYINNIIKFDLGRPT
jgi:hypothetical protein